MDAACRFVQARHRSRKRPWLCFDEWNVWYKNQEMDGAGKFAPHLIEEVYNLEDALVVAGFLHSFIRHADVVKIANLAQIVNVIAPLLTRGDDLLVQSIFHPFEIFSRRRSGDSLRVHVEGPVYTGRTNGQVTMIDASAIQDGDSLHVFATNRSLDQSCEVSVKVADRAITACADAELLTGPSPTSVNTFEQPDTIGAVGFSDATVRNGVATFRLPPLSLLSTTLRLG